MTLDSQRSVLGLHASSLSERLTLSPLLDGAKARAREK